MANRDLLQRSPMSSHITPDAPTRPSPLTVTPDPAGSYRGSTISGGSLGGDPFWGDSAVSQMHRSDVSAEQARAHQLAGLQQAFEESQRQGDVLEQKSDEDLFSGLTGRRFAGQATAQNAGLDVASEGEAGRSFLPNATAARTRDLPEQLAKIQAQYLAPAQMKGQYDVLAAHETAAGRGQAAQAHEATAPLRALQQIIGEMIAKGKDPQKVSDDDWKIILGRLGLTGAGGLPPGR